MLICGIILVILILWMLSVRWEWSVPLPLERHLKYRKKSFDCCSQVKFYNLPDTDTGELERAIWKFREELPRMSKGNYVFRLIIQLARNSAPGSGERYIACLQRRFPELEICLRRLDEQEVESRSEHEFGQWLERQELLIPEAVPAFGQSIPVSSREE